MGFPVTKPITTIEIEGKRYSVPEQIGEDVKLISHDFAKPFGVLNDADGLSKKQLEVMVGYVNNLIPTYMQALGMKAAISQLIETHLKPIKADLDKIYDLVSSQDYYYDSNMKKRWQESYHIPKKNWSSFLEEVGGEKSIVHEEYDDCCGHYSQNKAVKFEARLNSLDKTMGEFFKAWGWTKLQNGRMKPPAKMAYFASDSVRKLQEAWNPIRKYMSGRQTYRCSAGLFTSCGDFSKITVSIYGKAGAIDY